MGLLTTIECPSNQQNNCRWANRNVWLSLLLLIYILINIVLELHDCAFAVNLHRCVGRCNIPTDLSNKVCVPNKTEDLNLSVFSIITRINESKTLTKDISCEYNNRFDGRNCNSNQKWNDGKCRC